MYQVGTYKNNSWALVSEFAKSGVIFDFDDSSAQAEAAKKLDEAVYLGGIDNETDISGQIDLMNQAMEQGADGILLAPADSNSLADSCQKVREKDIPVVLIDSSINSSEFDACYMTDNIDA